MIEHHQIIMVDIDKIEPNPYQSRTYFDDSYIRELAGSIEQNGLLEPPTGRRHPTKPDITQIDTGEQRVRACKLLGWKQVPMIIKNITDRQMLTDNLAENINRKNIDPISEARQYKKLVDEFQHTHERIGKTLGKSRSYITNTLGLLTLDPYVQEAIAHELITARHGRVIKLLPKQYLKYKLTDIVIDWKLTVTQTEDIVKQVKEAAQSELDDSILIWEAMIPTDSVILPEMVEVTQKELDRFKEVGQEENITVTFTREVLDGEKTYTLSRLHRVPTIKVDMIYPLVALLDQGQSSYPIGMVNKVLDTRGLPSMFPVRSPIERERSRRFITRIRETESYNKSLRSG